MVSMYHERRAKSVPLEYRTPLQAASDIACVCVCACVRVCSNISLLIHRDICARRSKRVKLPMTLMSQLHIGIQQSKKRHAHTSGAHTVFVGGNCPHTALAQACNVPHFDGPVTATAEQPVGVGQQRPDGSFMSSVCEERESVLLYMVEPL